MAILIAELFCRDLHQRPVYTHRQQTHQHRSMLDVNDTKVHLLYRTVRHSSQVTFRSLPRLCRTCVGFLLREKNRIFVRMLAVLFSLFVSRKNMALSAALHFLRCELLPTKLPSPPPLPPALRCSHHGFSFIERAQVISRDQLSPSHFPPTNRSHYITSPRHLAKEASCL